MENVNGGIRKRQKSKKFSIAFRLGIMQERKDDIDSRAAMGEGEGRGEGGDKGNGVGVEVVK